MSLHVQPRVQVNASVHLLGVALVLVMDNKES